jgi:hypothetical protein
VATSSFKGSYCHPSMEEELVVALNLDTEQMDTEAKETSITLGIKGVVPPRNLHVGESPLH